MIADSPISVRKVFMSSRSLPWYAGRSCSDLSGNSLDSSHWRTAHSVGLRDVFQKSQTVLETSQLLATCATCWKKSVQNSTNILWNPTQEVAPSTAWNEA